jgi:hypothetical protein
MAAAALAHAARFDPDHVARRYELLFAELGESRGERARVRLRATHRNRLRDTLHRARLLRPARRAAGRLRRLRHAGVV